MKNKWLRVPKKDLKDWLSDYLVAGMVITGSDEKRGLPNFLRLKDGFLVENKDGSATLNYEVRWDKKIKK